jgi:P-type E1-E2 ATPase
VVEGTSSVNQSLVTGEALPVTKSSGDYLLAGTRNLNGVLICVVHRERQESFYAQLVQSVSEAGANKFKGQDTIGVVTRYFSMGVVVLAVLSPTLQLYYGPDLDLIEFYTAMSRFIERAMTILVSACPCALGLAVPSAVIAAVGKLIHPDIKPQYI